MTTLIPLFDTFEFQHQQTPQHPYAEDFQQANAFLNCYRGSLATFNTYRRELERLLQWSAHIRKMAVTQLTSQDIEDYVQFCQSPPDHWIALKKCDRFIIKEGRREPNPEWRPFVVTTSKTQHRHGSCLNKKNYCLSQKALQAIFAILSSFYSYLMQQNAISYNPVMQIRQKNRFLRQTQHATPIRRLSELQWNYVLETAEKLAAEDAQHERTLFILCVLYGMYLRISELASSARWQPSMRDFFCDQDHNWWFRTVGKGNKERIIAVSDTLLHALKRYRVSLDLPPLPDANDQRPLFSKNRGKGAITSTRHINKIVQLCFDAAYSRMCADGLADDAEQLKAATVHWLRHTGISEDVKHRPREHVRDDAGHSSSAITDRYIDVELRERHASSKKKTIKPI